MEWNKKELVVLVGVAFIMALGVLCAGFFIGNGFYMSRMADRYVTVKGLAEKDVVADLSVWNLKVAATGDVLTDVQGNIERQKGELLAFLKDQGIGEAEISDGQLSVTDLMAQQYRAERAEQSRFIVTFAVTVRSNDVQKVRVVSGNVGDLVKKGLVLADNAGPSYIFTKLNEIKPEMIAMATRSARQAAGQFAADSGSRVGAIRRASQGIFSIEARDGAGGEAQEGMPYDAQAHQIDKKVRVVSTIDYFLAN